MTDIRTRPRCNNCSSHGFFVTKLVNRLSYTVEYSYECIDCGENDNIEWEEY